MPIRNAIPRKFSPAGVSDALDGSNVFSGAMAYLQNLIPDPSTKNLWQCRPAAVRLTQFAGFNTPGFISAAKIIGTRVYGLVQTARNLGSEEPFCYDIPSGAFISITGVTAGNVPLNAPTTGPWAPPTMDLIGTRLVVTHPGFAGASNGYFGWFELSNPAAPAWGSGNTSPQALVSPPRAVAQFNQRAYFAVGSTVVFSDVLLPTTVTNANQALTLGDSTPITALTGLPLNSQLGGIVQSIIAFKGVTRMFQITGDYSSTNSPLSQNEMNIQTGTNAPLSITATPKGVVFMSPQGMRLIDFQAQVSDPIGIGGSGIAIPFINSGEPSRVCAASNGSVVRITTRNLLGYGAATQEWWFDIPKGGWSGPHTFPASLIQSYGNTFIVAPFGIPGQLYQSDVEQNAGSAFIENGQQLSFRYQTTVLPDTGQMAENSMIETTVMMTLAPGGQYAIQALDQNGGLLKSCIIPGGAVTQWAGFLWGQGTWGGNANALAPRSIPWDAPVVFKRMAMAVIGNSSKGFQIGDMDLRYQQLGYLQA